MPINKAKYVYLARSNIMNIFVFLLLIQNVFANKL